MSKPTLRLIDRLRGRYVLPVNDGAGPLNGSTTFEREFLVPPIHKEAAAEIERLTALNAELVATLKGLRIDLLADHGANGGLNEVSRKRILAIVFAAVRNAGSAA